MNISFRFLFKSAMLVSFLHSMYAWFFWHVNGAYIGLLVSAVVLFYIILEPVKLEFTIKRTIGVILLLIAYYLGYPLGLKHIVARLFVILPVILLIHIKDEKIHKELLDFIAWFFALLIPLSLVVFVLSFAGLPPVLHIKPPAEVYGSDFISYIFAMRSEYYEIRFASIFLEPGHLGMILAYLLYALNFNLKDLRVIIIILGIIFTLSLAAYILMILAFVFKLYANKKLKIRYIISGILFFAFLYIVAKTYNDGSNYLNGAFFKRLEYSEDKLIAGNNRTYGMFDEFYELAMEHKRLLLWGIGVESFKLIEENTSFGGAGVKIFILRHGLVAVFFYLLSYVFMGLSITKKNKRYLFGFILLFSFSFLQRAYPFWASWLIPFIVGLHNFNILISDDKR